MSSINIQIIFNLSIISHISHHHSRRISVRLQYLKMHTPTKPQLKGIGLYVVLIVIVRATSIVRA